MRRLRGSVTVEAAFLVPFILLIISMTITLLFYYHDKVVIEAGMHETVSVMSEEDEVTEEMVTKYFREQTKGRLLLFPYVNIEAEIDSSEVYVMCNALQKGMRISLDARMKRTHPETWVRTINNIIGE